MAVTTHALDIGAMTPFFWMFEEREKVRTAVAKLNNVWFKLLRARDSGFLSDVWILRAGVRSQNARRVRQTRRCPPGTLFTRTRRWWENTHWNLILNAFPGFAPGPDGWHLRVVQELLHQSRRSRRGDQWRSQDLWVLNPSDSSWIRCISVQMLTNNRIWKNRTVDIGVVTAEEALNYGFRWAAVFFSFFLFPGNVTDILSFHQRRDAARLGDQVGPEKVTAVRQVRRSGVRHPHRKQRRLLRQVQDEQTPLRYLT